MKARYEKSGKSVARRMARIKTSGGCRYLAGFAKKVAKMEMVTLDDLERMLPDYVAGWHVHEAWGSGLGARNVYGINSLSTEKGGNANNNLGKRSMHDSKGNYVWT